MEIREKMAVRPLTYVVLKEAALRAEEIEKEKNDREAKKKRPESTSNFSSRPSGTMFRGSGFQRGNFRGRGPYGTVRPSGSTCSFISHEFALRVYSDISSLGYDIYVSMPTGDVVLVNTVVKDCVVVMGDVFLKVNLVLINLRDFDVILGMDCLSHNHAVIDCQTKEVSM